MDGTITSAEILELPLEDRAELAFKAAFAKILDQYASLDLPLSIWQSGKVEEISAKELRKRSSGQQ